MNKFIEGCYTELSGSGVYIFYHGETPLYVGQTNDFKRRIYQHYFAAFKDNSPRPFYEYIREHKDEIIFETFQVENRDEEENRLITELSPLFNVRGKTNGQIDWLEEYEGKEYFVEDLDGRDAIEILRAARKLLSPVAFALFFELMFYEGSFIFSKAALVSSTSLTPKEIFLALQELEKKEFLDDDILYLESEYNIEKKITRYTKKTAEQKEIYNKKREEEIYNKTEELIQEYIGVLLLPEKQDELLEKSKEVFRTSDGTKNFTIKLVYSRIREHGYKIKKKRVAKKDNLPDEYYGKDYCIILPKTTSPTDP